MDNRIIQFEDKTSIFILNMLLFSTFSINGWVNLPQYFDNLAIENKSRETDNWLQENITNKKKDITFIVYIAADNDLNRFAGKNIKQMASIGSNEHINIAVQLNIRNAKNEKITNCYIVMKDKIVHTNANDPLTQSMDCGDPETLISCCKWAIETCPAKEYALILWDHGTGVLAPQSGRIISSSELFIYNPVTNKYELNRLANYLDLIETEDWHYRGICWDDTTGNYLTNQDLEYALKTISEELLGGEKLSILGFDACLMSMIEIANLAKKYVKVMVGSQEVILGPGWNYKHVLSSFKESTLLKENASLNYCDFAKHIIKAYKETYHNITDDYTLAAIDLEHISLLEENIADVASLLTQSIKQQRNNSVKKAIHASKNKLLCTHFDEPSYIDLDHFYHNLSLNLKLFLLKDANKQEEIKEDLKKHIEEGRNLIRKFVFANETGQNLMHASGLSIYFPERKIHSSYHKTPFAISSGWLDFLRSYHQ